MKSRDALSMATVCLVSFTILAIAKADPRYIEVPEFGFVLTLGYLLGKKAKRYASKVIGNADVPSVTELISCNPKARQKKRRKKRRVKS